MINFDTIDTSNLSKYQIQYLNDYKINTVTDLKLKLMYIDYNWYVLVFITNTRYSLKEVLEKFGIH